ncbi:MAG: DUF370 domain-containing protein [Ruminococcaceae bacterium]|nr:DUF370 domain-containing protein [Oscillospiraceae bacterium]
MYLHIGNNRNIREKNIIGIFDIESSTVSTTTRKYLSMAEKKGEVESSTEELPKSFILYIEDKKQKICFSQLSTPALLGRSGNNEN